MIMGNKKTAIFQAVYDAYPLLL